MELAAGGESGHSHLPAVTFNKGHSHNGGHSHSATPARGHSHGGHSHSVPNSVSAVAWMVILGQLLIFVVVVMHLCLSLP